MKFTQPVSMKCTEEQFNKDLKSELEKIGYIDKTVEWCDFDGYLCSNSYNNLISNFSYGFIDRNNRFYIDHYNAELFLALAAMTDKEDGNYGEYWKCIKVPDSSFTINKLYKQHTDNITNWSNFIDNNGHKNGCNKLNKQHFTKATKEEIINFFTKKETMIIVTIKKSDFKPLYDIACPEWKSKFDKFLIPFHFQDTISFEEKFIEEMRKACTLEQTPIFESIFGKKKVEIDYDKLKTGSKVMIKKTDQICGDYSKIDFSKPLIVVFYKTPQHINCKGKFFVKGCSENYITLYQDGNYCLFASDRKIDYITEVIEY